MGRCFLSVRCINHSTGGIVRQEHDLMYFGTEMTANENGNELIQEE